MRPVAILRALPAGAALTLLLAACGSGGGSTNPTSGPAYGAGGTTTTTARYGSTISAAPGQTTATTQPADAKTVADHLASLHTRGDITGVSGDFSSGIVIDTSIAPGTTGQGKAICDQAAMVARDAAITVNATDGSRLGGRDQGGQCA